MGGRGRVSTRGTGGESTLAQHVRRHRRGLAATASALAVLCLGMALRPPAPATRDVVVAARDLPTGHRIAPHDLALAQVPAVIMPPGSSAEAGPLAGQVLAAPLLAGEPVSSARLAGSLAALAAPPGHVPLPVRFADPAAVGLLSAGQSVDILASHGMADDPAGGSYAAPAQELAAHALVLAVTEQQFGDGGPTGPTGASSAPLVVVALTPDQARAVAGAEAASRLSFTLSRATP